MRIPKPRVSLSNTSASFRPSGYTAASTVRCVEPERPTHDIHLQTGSTSLADLMRTQSILRRLCGSASAYGILCPEYS